MSAIDSPQTEPPVAADRNVAAGAARAEQGQSGRLGRNLAALGAGQLFTWSMTLAWTLVVPRIIGPSGFGLIVTAMSVTGILQILLGMGTTPYVVRALVVDRDRASELLSTAVMIRLVLAPIFVVAVLAWAYFAHYGETAAIVLFLAAGATFLTMVAEPIQGAFQAIERMHYLAVTDSINKSAQGLIGIALALAGLGVVGFAGAWMVMSAVVVVLSIYWLRRLLPLHIHTSRAVIVDMLKGSVAYWAGGLFFMIYLWIDTVMLAAMTNAEVVGWYGVATKLFQTMMFLPVLVGTAWLPRLVVAFERSRTDLQLAARGPVEIVVCCSIPLAAAVAVGARPVIHVVYGAAFHGAVPALIILGVTLIPMYLNVVLAQICIAEKRPMAWTRMMVLATIFNPAVNALLIPATESRWHNGAIGASASLLLTELLIVAAGSWVVGMRFFSRASAFRAVRVTVASGLMVAVAYGTRGLGEVVSLGAAALTFLVAAAALRIVSRTELQFVRSRAAALLQRLPRRLQVLVPASLLR
jgi:O-antigen/teichoic acid export membrane protein